MKWEYGYHKYIHVLWHDIHGGHTFEEIKPGYVYKIVDMVNNHPEIFGEDNLFITPFPVSYGYLKVFDNVKYINVKRSMSARVVNICAPHCDWLFLHDICHPFEIIKIKSKHLKKIIWRDWGGVLDIPSEGDNVFKRKIKNVLRDKYKEKVRKFKMIGIGGVVDKICLEKCFGKLDNIFYMPYSAENFQYETMAKVKETEIVSDNLKRIMVGHSGFTADNHISLIDKIAKFCDKDVEFYFPLVNGEKGYIERVIEFAKKKLGNKANFILERMSYFDYCLLIKKMDVILFDMPDSNALGNLEICADLSKTLYVNKFGMFREALEYCGYPYRTTDEIELFDFDAFVKKLDYRYDLINQRIGVMSANEERKYWQNVIETLEK